MVTGLIFGAFGFGSFIFSFIATGIINPDNVLPLTPSSGSNDEFFPKDVADRFPRTLRICLIFWTILSIIAILTIKRNPEFKKEN